MRKAIVMWGATLVAALSVRDAQAQCCAGAAPWTSGNTCSASGTCVAFTSSSTSGIAIGGLASASTSDTYGVYGQSDSDAGTGVIGIVGATGGTTYGVAGMAASPAGFGVYGNNTGAGTTAGSGAGSGVFGNSATTGAAGVWGQTTASGGVGVVGYTADSTAAGIEGLSTSTTGTNFGSVGVCESPAGYGVYGQNESTGTAGGNGEGSGVYGTTSTGGGAGVYGSTSNGYGVYGTATANGGVGVMGYTFSATNYTSYGVEGQSDYSPGVYGLANNSTGVFGQTYSQSYNGVYGNNSSSDGGSGVLGSGTTGVTGTSSVNTGNGVVGLYGSASVNSSYSNSGVYGASDTNYGVIGTTTAASTAGVRGITTNTGGGWGVRGDAVDSGTAVYGVNTNNSGFAGVFDGNLLVQGTPYCTGAGCGWSTYSDIRLKKNVEPLNGALDRLLRLRGVTFEWKEPAEHANQTGRQTGFIAQEVEKVMPDWVTEDNKGFKTITTRGIDAMLVESVRTLREQNDELRDRVKALEAGRRPLISGFGEGGVGLGLLAVAGALVATRRKRSDARR